MKEPPPDPQLSILFGWCLILLLALPMGGFTAWHLAGKAAALAWPRTTGEVLASDLYRTTRPALWCVKLNVRYQVDGQFYESERTSSSRVAGTGCDREKHVIEARLERMRPGEHIAIRYNPQAPGEAIVYAADVLERIDMFIGAVAALWLACGVAAIRSGSKMRREQNAARVADAKPALH